MKFIELFTVLLVMLCGAFGHPLAKPVVRYPHSSTLTNLTITTTTDSVTFQSSGSTAFLNALISSNYQANTDDGTWFLSNQAAPVTQLVTAQGILLAYLGIPTGVSSLATSLQTTIDTLNQAQAKLAKIDSTNAATYSSPISALSTLQSSINSAAGSCASNQLAMYASCDDTLFTPVSQFFYQAASIMSSIVVTWSADVQSGKKAS